MTVYSREKVASAYETAPPPRVKTIITALVPSSRRLTSFTFTPSPQVSFQRRLGLHEFTRTSIKHVGKQTFLSMSEDAANVDTVHFDRLRDNSS